MKILHTSDLHLNSKMNSKLGRTKSQERRRELLLNFKRMTELARAAGAKAFIIAGDLFDTEKISLSVKKSALDIIASAPSVKFLYLTGNHEKEALIKDDLPENLLVFGEEWTYYTIDGVCFAGRRETAPLMFRELKRPKEAERLIAVLHGTLADKSDFGGIIGARELRDTEIDYLALGHYHSYSHYEFDKGRFAAYSGAPHGRGFDETGELGFIVLDTEQGVNFSFQKSDTRRLHNREFDLTGITGTHDLCDKISHACRDIPKTDLLRVTLVGGRPPEMKLDLKFAEERLCGSFYYFEIKDNSRLAISAEDYKNDKSLKGEFIRLVLLDEELSDKEKGDIISMGISALMGESL